MSEAMLSTDGHVFLDVSRPYVAWATYRGVLITPPNERTSTAQSQITVGQHHQSHVAVQARPEPAFVVVQSQLSLGILVESFDYPPAVGQGHLVMQCEGIKTPGEEKFVLPIVPFHGALADEPPTCGEVLATLTYSIDSHPSETLD